MHTFRQFLTEAFGQREFLQAHFKEPYEDSTLLVFADWLEENGKEEWGQLARYAIKGHTRQEGQKWYNEVAELLNKIRQSFQGRLHIVNDWTFDFGKKKRYRVMFNKIEEEYPIRSGNWKDLPEKKWTEQIVEGALFITLNRLVQQPVKRYKEDDEAWHDRPTGLEKRQVYQAMITYINWLNYIIQHPELVGMGLLNKPSDNLYDILTSAKSTIIDRGLARRILDLLEEFEFPASSSIRGIDDLLNMVVNG
jgi:uncharacterized protein (TIGR02996 family)